MGLLNAARDLTASEERAKAQRKATASAKKKKDAADSRKLGEPLHVGFRARTDFTRAGLDKSYTVAQLDGLIRVVGGEEPVSGAKPGRVAQLAAIGDAIAASQAVTASSAVIAAPTANGSAIGGRRVRHDSTHSDSSSSSSPVRSRARLVGPEAE